MRKCVLLLATAAILALPGAVFAQGTYISVVPSGVAYPAPTLPIGFDPSVDTQVVVDLYLDVAANTGIGFFLSSDSGAGASTGDALWTVSAFTAGTLPFGWGPMPGAYMIPGTGVGATLAANNTDPSLGGPGPANLFNMYGGAYPAGSLLGTATLVPTGGAAAFAGLIGTTLSIEADHDMNYPATGATIDGLLPTGTSVDVLVNITPEPATALLLLGAIPFLRRRR